MGPLVCYGVKHRQLNKIPCEEQQPRQWLALGQPLPASFLAAFPPEILKHSSGVLNSAPRSHVGAAEVPALPSVPSLCPTGRPQFTSKPLSIPKEKWGFFPNMGYESTLEFRHPDSLLEVSNLYPSLHLSLTTTL